MHKKFPFWIFVHVISFWDIKVELNRIELN
jgi:hypothetical protein